MNGAQEVAAVPASIPSADLVDRLWDEADLCHNDGAEDIAILLSDAAKAIVKLREDAAAENDRYAEYSAGWRAAVAAAVEACEIQQGIFGSEQYAVNQPMSSFGERFACGRCAEEIHALAQGIETRRAETGTGSVHESPILEENAPLSQPEGNHP